MREKLDAATIGHRNWMHSWSTGTKADATKDDRQLGRYASSQDGHTRPGATARKLGFSRKRSNFRRWSKREEDFLLQYAGSRNVHQLAQQLKRSEKSVREKLASMKIGSRVGISARVTDGHTKTELTQFLGRSPKTVQRWIDQGWLKGRYEGKQRADDTLRITDEDFRSFWKKHPWEVPFHTLSRDGMEWFFSVMIDIPMNEVRGDPLARSQRRKEKELTIGSQQEEEGMDDSELNP